MTETMTIPITMDGDEQVVRLPEGFRLPGAEVRVTRSGQAVLLQPIARARTRAEYDELFAELDTYKHIPFMEDGREQPSMPDDGDLPTFDR